MIYPRGNTNQTPPGEDDDTGRCESECEDPETRIKRCQLAAGKHFRHRAAYRSLNNNPSYLEWYGDPTRWPETHW